MSQRALNILRRLIPRGPRLLEVPAGVWVLLNSAAVLVLLFPAIAMLNTRGHPYPDHGCIEVVGGIESIFDWHEWPEDRDPVVIADFHVRPLGNERCFIVPFYVEHRYLIQAVTWDGGMAFPLERIETWVPEINRLWGHTVGKPSRPELDRWGNAHFYDAERPYSIIWIGVAWNLLATVLVAILPFTSMWWIRCVRTRVRARHWANALAAGRCPKCRYDIRGLPEPRCPECGETWAVEEVETA